MNETKTLLNTAHPELVEGQGLMVRQAHHERINIQAHHERSEYNSILIHGVIENGQIITY
jgi:hypothetical protein